MTEGLIGMEGGGTKLQTGKGNKGKRESTSQGKKIKSENMRRKAPLKAQNQQFSNLPNFLRKEYSPASDLYEQFQGHVSKQLTPEVVELISLLLTL